MWGSWVPCGLFWGACCAQGNSLSAQGTLGESLGIPRGQFGALGLCVSFLFAPLAPRAALGTLIFKKLLVLVNYDTGARTPHSDLLGSQPAPASPLNPPLRLGSQLGSQPGSQPAPEFPLNPPLRFGSQLGSQPGSQPAPEFPVNPPLL